MRLFRHILFGCAALAATINTASAENIARAVIKITAIVPVICTADFSQTSFNSDADVVGMGRINEFCNAGTGYRVIVDYPPSDDPGYLIVDGANVSLSSMGETTITNMSGPAIKTQAVSYHRGSTPFAFLSVRIEASTI